MTYEVKIQIDTELTDHELTKKMIELLKQENLDFLNITCEDAEVAEAQISEKFKHVQALKEIAMGIDDKYDNDATFRWELEVISEDFVIQGEGSFDDLMEDLAEYDDDEDLLVHYFRGKRSYDY